MLRKKTWVIIVTAVLVLWLAMGITDYFRVRGFELPVFCVLTNSADDGGSGTYIGLGYSFEVKGNFTPDHPIPGMTRYTYKIFGQTVKVGLRD